MNAATWKRLAGCLALIALTSDVTGQTTRQQSATPSVAQPPQVIQLPCTTTWKFGIRLTGTGETTRTQITLPVPVEWPEQKIRVVSIDTTDNVRGAKIKKKGSDASQLYFRVPKLVSGEVAEASVTIEIEKLVSTAPADTSRFALARQPKRALRKYLTPSPFIESNDDRIIELARSIPVNESQSGWAQVETIYKWVRENIEYRFDTEIRSCLTALDRGQGDCEEMSSLFVAICRARGIPARAVWIPGHTYPEFYLEDENGKGHWFPCQAAGSYAFGFMAEAKPVLQKGDKFKATGHRKPLRYIEPILKAYGASPQLEWIMKQVETRRKSAGEGR